jgi:hypothetical protein
MLIGFISSSRNVEKASFSSPSEFIVTAVLSLSLTSGKLELYTLLSKVIYRLLNQGRGSLHLSIHYLKTLPVLTK